MLLQPLFEAHHICRRNLFYGGDDDNEIAADAATQHLDFELSSDPITDVLKFVSIVFSHTFYTHENLFF